MKFYVEKRNILKNLKKIQDITEKNPIIPITSHMLIEAKGKSIIISATNFEVGMVVKHSAEVEREGRIVLDARKIYEIIKEMPEGKICMAKKDQGWIEISYDNKIIFNIAGLLEEEFPQIDVNSKINFFDINKKNIYELIRNTIYAASDDKMRDTLRGVLLEKQERGLRMVATDGHRLALADRIFSNGEEKMMQKSVIIPQKGAKEIKRFAEELKKEERIKIGFGENNVVVKGKEEIIVIRLIEGEFPNYKRAIPQNNKNIIILKTNDLNESLHRVALIINEDIKTVKLELKKDLLIISSKKIGFGEAREEREIKYSGDEIEIGLNSRYILDVLNTFEGEEVRLEMLDEKTPILIKEKDSNYNIAVIMPMTL